MELHARKDTFLTFKELVDFSDTIGSTNKISQLINALITMHQNIDNICSMTVTVEMAIARDTTSPFYNEFAIDEEDHGILDLEDDEEDQPDTLNPSSYKVGDHVMVHAPDAYFGKYDLTGKAGVITKLPNENTDMFMVKFSALEQSIAMSSDEFSDIPF